MSANLEGGRIASQINYLLSSQQVKTNFQVGSG